MSTRRWKNASPDASSCVDVAVEPPEGAAFFRDSKFKVGPTLEFTTGAFAAFLTGVKCNALRR